MNDERIVGHWVHVTEGLPPPEWDYCLAIYDNQVVGVVDWIDGEFRDENTFELISGVTYWAGITFPKEEKP